MRHPERGTGGAAELGLLINIEVTDRGRGDDDLSETVKPPASL
jgi:hypothetical protein